MKKNWTISSGTINDTNTCLQLNQNQSVDTVSESLGTCYLLDTADEDGVWLAGVELRCEVERSRTPCTGCVSAASSAVGMLRLGTCTGRTTTRSHAAT
jgi:hypothetical protein